MKKLIVNGVVGLLLFGGSLIGGLAATGRLNHDGVVNIPGLNMLFPEPPKPAEGAEGADGHLADAGAHPAPAGEAANAAHNGASGVADATHDGPTQDPKQPGNAQEDAPRRSKAGKSVLNPEVVAADPHGDGGHGAPDAGAKDSHGAKPAAGSAHGDAKPAGKPAGNAGGSGQSGATKPDKHEAERDFSARELALAQDQANKYSPGGFFQFNGMPSGITPEQLNEAWQRVEGVYSDLDKRKTALDLRDQELRELADDIGRRQHELGRLREELNTHQRALDDRIAKFQDQVKLVRNDEVAALRRNAQTLESFEASKAAELVIAQWGSEEGQTEILKAFEFMDKEKVNKIIQELENPIIQAVLKKRLMVSKEAPASGDARK